MGATPRLLFACIVLIAAQSAVCADALPQPFVYAIGRAEREVAPDLATLSLHVRVFNERSDAALATLQTRSDRVVELLEHAGVKPEDISAHRLTKSIVREQRERYIEAKIIGYEVERPFIVTLKDLSVYALLADSLASLENVSDIDGDFDLVKRKEIENELSIEASADARRRAAAMAEGLNAKITSVLALSESPFEEIDMRFGIGASERSYPARIMAPSTYRPTTVFVPATIKLSKSIYVKFAIVQK